MYSAKILNEEKFEPNILSEEFGRRTTFGEANRREAVKLRAP